MTRPPNYPLVTVYCLCAAMALDLASLAQAQTKPSTALDNPVAALSLDQLSVTRERPLFSPTRRAPRPLTVMSIVRPLPPPLPPSPPPKIELYGTIIDAADALAIVVSTADNQTVRLRLGDEIGGWKVIVIDQRKLVLSHDERVAEFTIFADKTPAAVFASKQQKQDQQILSPPKPGVSLGRDGVKQQ
jgi:hypothetical protein